MSINRVNISGHLTRDPELRMTPKGTQVLSFGIAVNDRRLNRETNQWEDYPNFVECTMFGTRAEAVGRIVRKGMKVSIDGKLRFNQWETKDGQKRSRLTVVVDTIDFMSQGNQSQNASANRPAAQTQQTPVFSCLYIVGLDQRSRLPVLSALKTSVLVPFSSRTRLTIWEIPPPVILYWVSTRSID